MKTRPKYGWSQYSNSAFKDKAQLIKDSVYNVPELTAVPVTQAQLSDLVTAYAVLLAASLNRSKVTISERNDARESLETALTIIAGYIQTVTTDKAVIEAAGYNAVERGNPVGKPAVVTNSFAKSYGPQTILIEWDRVPRGVNNYIVFMSTSNAPDAEFQPVGYPTASRFEVTGLNPLTYYYFTVRANGAGGLGDPCPVITGLSI